ncbi:hypothetical protein D3C81_1307170 [compost metagenome]
MPGVGVAGAGLLEQQLMCVGLQAGVRVLQQGDGQRPQPHRRAGKEGGQQQPPRPTAARASRLRVPPAPGKPWQQHQQWQEAHALGHRTHASGERGQCQRAPVRPQQQVAHQAPQGQRGHAQQHHVDLRPLGHQPELDADEQAQYRIARYLPVPQPARHIPGQPQRQQRRQQGRHQEGQVPAAEQLVGAGLNPHEGRWLLGIQLAAAVGQQPLPGLDHVPGSQYEAGFIRWLRRAHAEPGQQAGHDQRDDDGKPQGGRI